MTTLSSRKCSFGTGPDGANTGGCCRWPEARRRRPARVVNLHRFASMAVVARIIGAPENAGFEGVSRLGVEG